MDKDKDKDKEQGHWLLRSRQVGLPRDELYPRVEL
jgi:hypothetical protein